MSFDWTEYLDLAQQLAGSVATASIGTEAKYRAAISRAYYAAFCKSRNYLRDIDGTPIPKSGDAHRFVKNEFKSSADTVRQSIGKDLDRLRIERNKADYDDVVASMTATTKFALSLAQNIISGLGKL